MSSEKKVYSEELPDGTVTLTESYINGELDLVSIEDHRDKTVDQLYSDRAVSVLFIFRVHDDVLQISRIFAQTEKGGFALDTKRMITGGFRESFHNTSLMDDQALSIIQQRYPEKRIDKQQLRDKIRNLYRFVLQYCRSRIN